MKTQEKGNKVCNSQVLTGLSEAAHPTDGLDYPLLPSHEIKAPMRHDAPYCITTVILPMEEDQSKWN